jgi:hypothetical protein
VRALGLTVEMKTPGRPVVHAVLLEDSVAASQPITLGDVNLDREFDLTTAEKDWARICSQYAQDVSGRVSSLALDVVVVRRADFHRNSRSGDGPKLRLVIEGAITAAAMGHLANTHLQTGAACAGEYPEEKDAMDAAGRGLVSRPDRAEAAAAALSGLFSGRF